MKTSYKITEKVKIVYIICYSAGNNRPARWETAETEEAARKAIGLFWKNNKHSSLAPSSVGEIVGIIKITDKVQPADIVKTKDPNASYTVCKDGTTKSWDFATGSVAAKHLSDKPDTTAMYFNNKDFESVKLY